MCTKSEVLASMVMLTGFWIVGPYSQKFTHVAEDNILPVFRAESRNVG
jgi:hypothetical protein